MGAINGILMGVYAVVLLGLVKHKTWKIYGKEMTLTFNTHIPS